jgi:phosphoadenosine phosphosulfate reductase
LAILETALLPPRNLPVALAERLPETIAAPTHTFDEAETRARAASHCNHLFAGMTAEERVAWALEHLPGEHLLTSSFGVQAAVLLHLVTRQRPGIPVLLIDTGYLFPETYQFVDQLTERLALNLTGLPGRPEPGVAGGRYGKRWQQGVAGLDAYNRENKVEPMERALRELRVGTWFAGLRRSSRNPGRRALPEGPGRTLEGACPIADWSDRDVFKYLKANDLPYHPLHAQGYVSVGDVHTTRPIHAVKQRRRDPLLRPEARVRPARDRPVRPLRAARR